MSTKRMTINVILLYCSLTCIMPMDSQGQMTTTSWSIPVFRDEDSITSEIRLWVISSSAFGDIYTHSQSLSSVIEYRSCDCGKPPDLGQVRSYVDQQYAAYPKETRQKIYEALAAVQQNDRLMRLKMSNPLLSDDEVLMYGRERERLILKGLEMERQLNADYLAIVNPNGRNAVESQMKVLKYREEDKISALAFGASIDITTTELTRLYDEKRVLISTLEADTREMAKLLSSSVKPSKSVDNCINEFINYIKLIGGQEHVKQ